MDRYETCASFNSYVQNPLFGTEHFDAQEPKRIHVIVEYMSSPYLRSAVGVVLDCFHMPGRGQALPVVEKALAVVPASEIGLRTRRLPTRFRRTSISHGRWTIP